MDIREGNPIKYFKGNEVQIIRPREVIDGMYTWADEIICATNAKRNQINNKVRSLLGFEGDPQEGDKVISLSNHWGITDFSGNSALVNGTIGVLGHNYKDNISYPVFNKTFPKKVPVLQSQFTSEVGDDFGYLTLDYKAITTGEKFLTPQQEFMLYQNKNLKGSEPMEFSYGYAITCHRAQGSEWDKVLIFEERFPFDKEEHARWVYTAVTRGSSRVVLVR